MKRSVVLLLAVCAVVVAVWYLRVSPSLVVTSPSGGEVWQAGEEHTLTWRSVKVPDTYHIAVSIRRVPPPPQREEGQEFDPIVFTDLANTGSTTWAISPMYPDGTYVLELHAYKSLPITEDISAESGQFTISHPKLSDDVMPLYAGVPWQTSQVETVFMGTTTYKGASVASAPIDAGMDPGKIFTAFGEYYDEKLKALGWRISNDLAAGGHVGGQTGYRKGDQVILTRFMIDYKVRPEDAPSECPCDVTLSVFETAK